jgi:hypothetical protein
MGNEVFDLIDENSKFAVLKGLIRAGDLIRGEDTEESEWILKDFVVENGITLLAGEPASYKTTIALLMAKAISEGEPYMGIPTVKKGILFIDLESGRKFLKKKFKKILNNEEGFNIFILSKENQNFKTIFSPEFENLIEIAKGGVVIIDSFRRAFTGDEDKSEIVNNVMNRLRELALKHNVSFILLHHRGKNPENEYRGSSDILASVDIAYSITRGREEKKDILTLRGIKNRYGEEKNYTWKINESDTTITIEDYGEVIRQEKEQEEMEEVEIIEEAIKSFEEQGKIPIQGEIIKKVEKVISKNKARELLKEYDGKRWISKRGDKNCVYYSVFQFSTHIYNGKQENRQTQYTSHSPLEGIETVNRQTENYRMQILGKQANSEQTSIFNQKTTENNIQNQKEETNKPIPTSNKFIGSQLDEGEISHKLASGAISSQVQGSNETCELMNSSSDLTQGLSSLREENISELKGTLLGRSIKMLENVGRYFKGNTYPVVLPEEAGVNSISEDLAKKYLKEGYAKLIEPMDLEKLRENYRLLLKEFGLYPVEDKPEVEPVFNNLQEQIEYANKMFDKAYESLTKKESSNSKDSSLIKDENLNSEREGIQRYKVIKSFTLRYLTKPNRIYEAGYILKGTDLPKDTIEQLLEQEYIKPYEKGEPNRNGSM